MAMCFQLFIVFCVSFLGVNASKVKRPQLYIANNNLHFEIPSGSYIQFAAPQIKVNEVDLLSTLKGAQNATKLLGNYETFISQFNSKMDDMESKILSAGAYSPPKNTTNATIGVWTNLDFRLRALRRELRQLKLLLTKNECASNPCQNGGTCIDIFNGFLCQCPKGWEGFSCAIDINECARFAGTDLSCQNGGTCINLPGTYQCQCPTGWIGMHCNRKPTDCNSGGFEICGHGTCVPQNNEAGYKCLCDSGWTTDGTHMACSIDVDECKLNHPPCSTNPLVQCVNVPGSFMCQHCPPGYTGNGYYCADINECDLFNGGCSVSPYVECLNTPGSHKCGTCPAGYEGDGKTCSFKGVCNINNGGCSILARCVNNPAIAETYVQCICPQGYVGSGIGPNGCMKAPSNAITSCSPNPCVHGICVGNSTNGFSCICDKLYIGKYCDQVNDVCAGNPCMNGGTCIPLRRVYICSCKSGFTGGVCQYERQACGDYFDRSNGTIKYPSSDFDSSRGTESLSCAWTIKTQQDKVIEITFTKFNFAGPPCTSQWFQVHDGRNSLDPALGRFCGSTLPFNGTLTTTKNVIYFWLRSNDQTGRRPEFELSWKTKNPECGGTLQTEGIGMIVSPGWPNNYPNNRECYWRFSVPVNKRLLFHVYSLNIGQDSDCTGDYLEFYNKRRRILAEMRLIQMDRVEDLFAKLCNSTIPQPFYSTVPSGHIYFKSNDKDPYPGFQIGYSVVDGVPGCGGTYTTENGYIQSLTLTSSMPTQLNCVYEIKLPVNTTVKIAVLEMDLDSDCDQTNFAVYVESSTSTSLVDKYCGNSIPGPIMTYASHVFIKSKSMFGLKSHWKIRYEAVCHQTYTAPNGTISANLQLGRCTYSIEQPAGKIILLDLELTSDYDSYRYTSYYSSFKNIKVWDGDNENTTLLGTYSEVGKKVKLESTTNYLLIKSASIVSSFKTYLSVTYRTIDVGCGGLFKNDFGTIAYPPRSNDKYPKDKKCRWVIVAPPGKVIQITWMTFHVEQAFECPFDSVTVFDNSTDTGIGGLIGKYCGYNLPPVLLSSSNIMTIDFKSDNSVQGEGFTLSYTFIKEDKVCGGNYFTPAGVIKSPGYPQNYPTNRECVWTITVQPGNQILLQFTNFSLEAYSSCRYDWLEVRQGSTALSPLIGKYCGTTYPKTIPSHTNKLYLKFNSDISRTGRGFKLEWTSTATGCGGTLTSPSGSIMSPQYPEPYTKNTDCMWRITVSAGSKIQIVFADLDLEKFTGCALDFLQLLDGPTLNSNSLGKYCSVAPTNPVVSSKNTMLVRFRSDQSFQGRGFHLQYSTVCTNTLKGFRGVIESPNFPNDYPHDQNCVWDIVVSEGNKINISFSHFALERSMTTLENKSCAFDYLEIEYASRNPYGAINDEEEREWHKYDRYCGDRNPGFITIDASMARIHFVSDSLLLGTGFRLEWQLYGCGGLLTDTKGTIQSPNYPNPYPSSVECNWLISVPLGQSINIKFDLIDVEKDSSCNYDYIQIYNGKDDTYQELAQFCHQMKPVTITSAGNNMFVKFKADYSYEGSGFRAVYGTTPTNCGGLMTAPKGYIYSPNYPKNFNRNESCGWLIETDENHVIELKFDDVDLERIMNCRSNYIKVYDGPNEAYPVLETVCGNTTVSNKTIRSSYEHMYVEFRSDFHLTSKGFKAQYQKACGAKIKTSGSGTIQIKKEFAFGSLNDFGETICDYTIEAEDKSKHLTLIITRLDLTSTWCSEDSAALKIYNGPLKTSPLIGQYCASKVPPPIISDGPALRIEVSNELDLFATYSVLDDKCGGEFQAQEGYIATPGWPKRYPANAQCSWIVSIGPGSTINMNFINFSIPESENCNTDYLEIRETNATGKLLGVFCGINSPPNVTAVGTLYLMFKSSRLDEGVPSTNKGFNAEFATTTENKLSGPEGFIGNRLSTSYGSYTWLITTNVSTVIELSFIVFRITSSSSQDECYGTVMKVYDGMDTEAPLLKELCTYTLPDPILSTSNMMYISLDFYTSRIEASFLLKWKELPRQQSGKIITTGNTTKSECGYVYEFIGQDNQTFSSPGYPNGYAPNLQCEWIFSVPSQYHLQIRFTEMDLGSYNTYRVCTYTDTIKVYTKHNAENAKWEMLKEFCNTSRTLVRLDGSDMLKVEFQSNKYLNGSGFQAKVFGVCGGIMTAPSGVIQFDKDHAHDYQCQWNITVRAGRTIKLTFEQFDLTPSDTTNCKNYLIIRNGKFADSPFLGQGKFCTSDQPHDLESSSNHLYLSYVGSPRIKGFKIKYTEVSINCGQDYKLSSDESSIQIASPNYPNVPAAHSECIWIVRAPPGEALRVDFEEQFDISESDKCLNDYLELRDGGTEISPLIGTYCVLTPNTLFTTDNMLRMKYFTDSNEPRNGFKANVSISYCGGTFRGRGTISTKEPHAIRPGSNCTWYLKAPPNYNLIITFPVFLVAPRVWNCSLESVGKVRIYERTTIPGLKNSTELGLLCGQLNITKIRSNTNEVVVNYLPKTDQDEFLLNFRVVKEDCGGTLTQETGTITSPGYPELKSENSDCRWKIIVPKGRKISMYMVDVDLDPTVTYLAIFQGQHTGPRMLSTRDFKPHQTYETSDNTAQIYLWHEFSSSRRGFEMRFTSEKQTDCVGDFNATSGQIPFPQTKVPYMCEYKHTQLLNEETLAITAIMETNVTIKNPTRKCYFADTGITIMINNGLGSNTIGSVCRSTNNRPVIFRSSYRETELLIRQNLNSSLNFTISFKTYKCGGLLTDETGNISNPNFPNSPGISVECSWRIKLPTTSHRIKVNFTILDLGDDCEKSYLVIYNGNSQRAPTIGKFCKNYKPDLIVSQDNTLVIEYRYEKASNSNPSKGFNLIYEPEIHGCGGVYQSTILTIQSPNYGKEYGNNQECLWEIRAPEGNMVAVKFFDRFFIEDSKNCDNDYVEIFDWRDDTWISMGKKCGRNLPQEMVSSSNQLRIIFRSNQQITGIGFKATWSWRCGGTLEATDKERYLVSPGYPLTYLRHTSSNCTYKIVSNKDQGIVRIKFLDFALGPGLIGALRSKCEYTNLTISGTPLGRLTQSTKQTLCDGDIPGVMRFKKDLFITFMNSGQYISSNSGFKLAYKDESCGGNITKPTALMVPASDILPVRGYLRSYQYNSKIACTWYITAPPNQIAVLSIHNLSMTLGIHCMAQSLEVFDGLEPKLVKRLAQLCGKIDETKPIPSTSNTMLVKLDTTPYNFHGFQGEVYFTYGPSVGCGGTINLTETKRLSPPNNLPHMDCHWIITAPRDYKVQLEFSDISVSASCSNPVRNHTYYCTCSYIEVRDGGGPFADQMVKLCSSDNNSRRTLTTSWNTAYIRLYSADPQNDMFRLTLTPVQSKCGSSQLTATNQFQELRSPDYPNSYPENIKCTWVIKGRSSSRFLIHFEEFDFPGDPSSELCDGDRLELTEDPNQVIIGEGFGPAAKHQLHIGRGLSREAFKYAFCDNKTKPFDYYTTADAVTLTFYSVPYSGRKGKGFKLKYGSSGCNRTIHANEGRIENEVVYNDDPNCVITIISDPNTTLSLYFIRFYYISPVTNCSTSGLEIKENDATGPELLKACGFRLPNPVFSNSNQLYIRSYYTQSRAPPYFKYNFLYMASEKGKGCGGKMFNYMGKFSSPMYPNPYRKDTECTWDLMVPRGYKVALKLSVFNIGGGCMRNKLVVTTYSEGLSTDHTFCPEDNPAVLFSDNNVQVTYYSSVNNGGTGWLASFQAVKEEKDSLLWF